VSTPGGSLPVLDVVIVNWNTGACLRACLDSLAVASASVPLGRVIVVDNASTDDSASSLPSSLPVTLIRNEVNRGFAAACNQGSRLGSGQHVLFLNPDTVLLPDTVHAALAFLESPAAASSGICGGFVLRADGRPGISASRFPTLANIAATMLGLDRVAPRLAPHRHLPPDGLTRSGAVDQVIGAFFLVRRSLFDRLGGFDERYFLYYEEVDFCRRARALGFGAYFLAEARLIHVGNVSARRSGGRALYHSLRSRTLYAFRHWPRPQAYILVALTVAVELPARLTRAVLRGSRAEIAGVGRAAASYLRFLARSGPVQVAMRPPPPTESPTADTQTADTQTADTQSESRWSA
jgi:N-acetylglucosaminyl-diphospho-decaprenol L-rhamnosyltransferase